MTAMLETSNKKKFEDFLESVSDSLSTVDSNDLWPLKVPQMILYFDTVFALELYDQLQRARKKANLCQIATLFKMPSRVRILISGADLPVALKVLSRSSQRKSLTKKELLNFLEELFDMLICFNETDPFCLRGTDKILKPKEIEELINNGTWLHADEAVSKKTIGLSLDLYNLCWAFYYSAWLPGGLQIHGPYEISKGTLLVRDYYDLAPTEVWDLAKQIPHKRIRISQLFRKLTGKINFLNQPHFNEVLSKELKEFRIDAGGENVSDLSQFEQSMNRIAAVTQKQTDLVNRLSRLDRIRKAAEICWYLKRDLSEFVGENWLPPKEVENNIRKYGEKFARKYEYVKKYDRSSWMKFYNIENDFIGD